MLSLATHKRLFDLKGLQIVSVSWPVPFERSETRRKVRLVTMVLVLEKV